MWSVWTNELPIIVLERLYITFRNRSVHVHVSKSVETEGQSVKKDLQEVKQQCDSFQ